MNWKGKKVMVTGACGFIGSHLVERLVELGAETRAFVYYNSFNNWGWIDSFPKETKEKIDVFCGDIRDEYSVKEAMKGIEFVFHLAALIAIPYSYYAPNSYVATNIQGTLNVLQAARELGVAKIIHTSTSEVYGTARSVPIEEGHPLQPQSPYSATKISADMLAESFYRSFDLPVVIARPFNTYGPRQSARAVIPTIITQLLSGRDRIRLGSQHPTRDFTFVKDTVSGFIKIAEYNGGLGQVFNMGTNSEIAIGDLANKIKLLVGQDVEIEFDESRTRPKKSEVERLVSDNSRLKELTGWKPEYSLDQGLKLTIDWLKNNLHYYKSGIYNL